MDNLFVLVFCAVGIVFMSWIAVLKMQISEQEKEIERLTSLLKKKLGHIESQVEVSGRNLTQKHDGKPH